MNVVRLDEERALAMDRVEALGFLLRQVPQPHRTNAESRVFDALDDPAGKARPDGVWLDDGKCGSISERLYPRAHGAGLKAQAQPSSNWSKV